MSNKTEVATLERQKRGGARWPTNVRALGLTNFRVGVANPTPPPGGDMEREVEGRGAGLDGRDVVAPLRTVGATMLGSVGDGRGGETALQGAGPGGWGSLGAAAGAGRQGWRGFEIIDNPTRTGSTPRRWVGWCAGAVTRLTRAKRGGDT